MNKTAKQNAAVAIEMMKADGIDLATATDEQLSAYFVKAIERGIELCEKYMEWAPMNAWSGNTAVRFRSSVNEHMMVQVYKEVRG